MYDNIAYQIRNWLPQLRIAPLPAPADLDVELERYGLSIVSPPRYLRKKLTSALEDAIRRKWVLICQHVPDS